MPGHIWDMNCNAGKHLSKETRKLIPGSPLNALAVQPQFKEFHLIDIVPEKIETLREFVGSRKDVFLYRGDCSAREASGTAVLAHTQDDFRQFDERSNTSLSRA